ncbi:hypothetical protein AAZX31_02G119800 [Glycine max]|uniref:F-box/FBD/LRR-repeat protein n=2 Tax=Glycine soja TaxID=3848 RepID=A0A445LN84_GLYSO|nr:F-box/FBD/LRR-repeat protein At1g13570 [Glycine max]KHN29901.1 F-box/FBD/LRR-repeat protein [Glycine soja]KAG5062937.1 hypothetical protein JHK85_004120 [Glycine max]KAG5079883.1 hypothetical protein JHK86_003948 [Glycine max]KAH1060048.1 hypothetical protein GYH30_003841 [Glycine max]KAH1261273.1 F-box/FBD/LRR-repeat protein [Glycine max]|eukprot:XP_006575848.3 F-box/FBD/LRR-repeat protein At1g13570 [Glycine max]
MTARFHKIVVADPMDRISDLPSHLIDFILQRLQLQDVVRTSLLSSKWRYKWTSVPKLDFSNDFFQKCRDLELHEVSSTITEILLIHDGPLDEFVLCIPENVPIKIESLNKWILCLSRKGIKELELWNLQTDPCETPSHIFSCQGLTYLQLQNFKLSTVPNFSSFKSLVYLILVDIIFESSAIDLMFGCPSLEMLSISYCSGFECINVSSPALEVLHVQGEQVIKSIYLEKAKRMTDVSLMADNPGDNFDMDTISNLIKGLSEVESMCFTEGYIQIFSTAYTLPKSLQKPLNCLESLELEGVNFDDTTELLFVISLLKSSPNLEKLFIQGNYIAGVDLPQILEKSKYNGCCLSHLLTVHIKAYKPCENTMNFIRFLLANSTSLELLTFYIVPAHDHQQHQYSISSVGRELKQMARASKSAVVEFIDLSFD